MRGRDERERKRGGKRRENEKGSEVMQNKRGSLKTVFTKEEILYGMPSSPFSLGILTLA